MTTTEKGINFAQQLAKDAIDGVMKQAGKQAAQSVLVWSALSARLALLGDRRRSDANRPAPVCRRQRR